MYIIYVYTIDADMCFSWGEAEQRVCLCVRVGGRVVVLDSCSKGRVRLNGSLAELVVVLQRPNYILCGLGL